MLGCGLAPNTTMHAIEEVVEPDYLFGGKITYAITDYDGEAFHAEYVCHGFVGWKQRYDRVSKLQTRGWLLEGDVLNAKSYSIKCEGLWREALKELSINPLYFVDRIK